MVPSWHPVQRWLQQHALPFACLAFSPCTASRQCSVCARWHSLKCPPFVLCCLLARANRVQFFQLADIFLSSGMVPAYTAAAFAKKFGRLALRAPPAGAMLALGFIHNIIRRHPACMLLLHKQRAAAANGDADGDAPDGAGVDVFEQAQADPAQSRAVESSFWELAALRNHYCPQVSHRVS
eukprot:GHRQ01019424.1.p1 GENE.GHRQ01019424.1~~GHRQ01019424.1.p1  ORF type:complete len:181 (+),score=59.66 GHRQ01019424.1:556-1098(+)